MGEGTFKRTPRSVVRVAANAVRQQELNNTMSPNDSHASAPQISDQLVGPLFDIAPCGMLLFGPKGELLKVNPTLLRWLNNHEGIGREPTTSSGPSNGHRPLTFENLKEQLQMALEGTVPAPAYITMHRADGTALPLQASSVAIRPTGGDVAAVLTTLHDLSEVEERVGPRSSEMLKTKRRYALMIDALQDSCIYFIDASGHITEWSESAHRLHGFTHDQAARMSFADLAAPRAGEPEEISIEDAIRLAVDRGQWEYHGWRLRVGTDAFWGQTLITALRGENGELEGLSCITRDMTAMKDLDRVMNDLNAELDRRVKARVRQYTVPNKDLDIFTHSITHDLRGPLRHINTFAGLIAEELGEEASEEIRHYRDGLKRSSSYLNGMIESLLTYSRLGRVDLHPAPLQLQATLDGVIDRLTTANPGREISWNVHADLPQIFADEGMVADLFVHLLDNAVKFTRQVDRAEIEIGSRTESDGSTVFFVVDNGVGFDVAKARNLFLMFQRQHHSLDFEGYGAGLALSQRIVQRHNGSIWADSTPGHGCAVYFKLPVESRS